MSGDDLQLSYDLVAEEYAARIFDELQHKPLDRELLDRFAERVKGRGPVCDLGCGPGHVARYLHERGVAEVFGLDLSPGMVATASALNPHIPFRQGDMLALEDEEGAWGGIAAFYSIIHIGPEEVVRALSEMARVLRPGGFLLLAFHVGDEALHVEELWDFEVSIDSYFYRPADMEAYLRQAGLEVVERHERGPYPDVEYESQRAHILARKREAKPIT